MSDTLLIRRDPPVGWLILNRPEKLNALDLSMWTAIPEKIAELEQDDSIRVIIIRGAGDRAFGAGADIDEFEEQRKDPATGKAYAEANDLAFMAVRKCIKPTIAMIQGFCIGGGCALALCADIRIAAHDAKFAITPARLGLGYAFSGVEHAVQELGPGAARYMFLTAQHLESQDALRLGVVHEIHPSEEVEAKAKLLGEKISGNAPKTLRAIKEAVLQTQQSPDNRNNSLMESLIADCFSSKDYQEGLRAFAEKRKPRFEGK